MATLYNDDKFLVNDGTETTTVTFEEIKKGPSSTMLNDTDKFLVNDGTKTETVTWAQMQAEAGTAPVIDLVTLMEDEPETKDRFTNQSFTTIYLMTDDGRPASAKGMRAWVDGALTIRDTSTDEIVGVSPDGTTLTFSGDKDLSVLEAGDYIEQDNAILSTSQASELDPADTVGGSITNNGLTFTATTASTYSRSKVTVEDDEKIQFEMTADNIGSGALIGFSEEGTDGSPGPGIVGAVYDSTGNIRYTGNWSTGPTGTSYTTADVVGATLNNTTGEITFYKNGVKQPSVFITPNKRYKLYVHSNMGQVTANFGADGFTFPVEGFSNFERYEPAGIIGSIDVDGLTITMSKVYGDWGPENNGHYAIGPEKQSSAGKQYLKLDQATLNVIELQSAETAYTPITTAAPKITFGATLGTADTPDDLLPEGTSIQTEIKATNGIEPDSIVQSNPVTPIKVTGPKATMYGLRFDGDRETYFENGPGSTSNNAFIFSVWLKRTTNDSAAGLMAFSDPPGQALGASISFSPNNDIQLNTPGTSYSKPSGVPLNQWAHVVLRRKINGEAEAWVNGKSLGIEAGTAVANCAFGKYIGRWPQELYFYDGYMSDLYFVDGQEDLDPTDFGEDFEGKWGPLDSEVVKTNVGDFGANGFFLPFNPDTGIGIDASGNNNHFTKENFVLTGSFQDYSAHINGGFNGSDPDAAFDGETTTFTEGPGAGEAYAPLVVTFSPALSYSSTLEIYTTAGTPYVRPCYPNDESSSATDARNRWTTIRSVSSPTSLNKLTIERGTASTGILGAVRLDGKILVDFETQDTVKDNPMTSYAVLEEGLNGNLVASRSLISVTYLGKAGTDYYYEEDGVGKIHTGGGAFVSEDGRTYNFGQQPFGDVGPQGDEQTLFQTWKEWNNYVGLFADNPEHVAKFEAIKEALESYEGNLRQYRAELLTRLVAAGFNIREIDSMDLINIEDATTWATATGYEDGALVTHEGEYWYALSSSYNNSPDDNDPEDWLSMGPVD